MPVNDELAHSTWQRFQECRDNGHLEFLEKAEKCDKFAIGKQWAQEDLDALKLQRRPALTINKILSTLSTILGEQIDNRSESLFRPASGAATAAVAEALTKVWMQIAANNQLTWARSDLFCDGLIRSRGFLDVRLDFTDSMIGEVSITNLNSKNVVIDPDAEDYDPDRWNDVIISKWLTPQDVEIVYSKADAELLRDKDGSAFAYGYDSIERVRDRFAGPMLSPSQYAGDREPHGVRKNIRVIDRQYRRLDRQEHFVDVKTGDMRAIPASWDRDKIALVLQKGQGELSTMKKLVKRVRWTVVADNIVLHDDWSPYKHFTVVPYFPFFRYGETVGAVENLLGSQELLNKVSSQELHVVNTTANSGWKVRTGALKNMSTEELEQAGAQTGLVLELDEINNAEKITPNATPQGLDRISYKAEEHIKTISNVSDSMQGFDREDVAAKAIAYKKQSGSVGLSKSLDNLARTDWILTRNVLDIVQEFYTEQRLVNITHSDATREAEQITVNEYDEATGEIANDLTLGEYSIIITSTPARASMEDSQFDQAMGMREAGIAVPDSFIIENSRLNRKAEVIKQMEGDKDSPEAQAAAALEQRAREAEVQMLEAQAMEKQASAKLKMAQVDKTIAEAQATQAEIGQGDGADPALEQQTQEREFALKADEHLHKKDLAEREFALKADEHAHKKQLADQKSQQDAETARAATFAKSRPVAPSTQP
jgi:hypothetical protein